MVEGRFYGGGLGLGETVVYEVVDEIVKFNSRHFHTFFNHQKLTVVSIMDASG